MAARTLVAERALTKMRGLLLGFSITRSISLAAELGITDRLADDPRTAAELARECGSDPESTGIVLRVRAHLRDLSAVLLHPLPCF